MINQEAIESVINRIKRKKYTWKMSQRVENLNTLSKLKLTQQEVFNYIFDVLTWTDYISGPEMDRHYPPIPGEVWIFGLEINHVNTYLKFQDRTDGIIFWISIHEARFPLHYYFSEQDI
ncbi:hypothetical protein [Companilactobacillus sp.]|jgi:hypothetical protein|uniref:hypothetical protein n=1 Tax=Companilactobacillus sp. TaxID=2767905 RepID=UPI0025BBC766|nr:hypothetical protein [Companilactobacillus sp.]MCH4009188.1 hypothetical protein [Companilactobacillus sp.]MCH4050633.1 hypothetical protein [Companilactobacillus sp.]MCH4077130.1 hypothetical protein [Companilactobacillus sp.]MCH4125706.1 hypothetical protein [Companilactobacillus sp.]MCI1311415.1 hypothetical protein [Companilactobacillus sp.]